MRALSLIVALLIAVGCKGNYHARVGEILIPQATSTIEAEPGETVEWTGEAIETLPAADVIRLAIHRDVSWFKVRGLVERIEAENKRAVLLVGRRLKVRGFDFSEQLEGEAIEVFAQADGKACVSLPGVPEAKCVQTVDKKHISRAYMRELVREAVGVSDLVDVAIDVSPRVAWADVVRAVDGARTCCKGTKIRVMVQPPEEL